MALRKKIAKRDSVPIIVILFHREEETRRMLEQLRKVTDNYSLIIVNNGFGDQNFLKSLDMGRYIENNVNTGTIKAVNQGLDVAEGKYVAVLHADLLIFEEGWLEHIIQFMERRTDVGLVGLAGRHTINANGTFDINTTITKMIGYPASHQPTWRFTEVATIDGLGWVMRNIGLRLDEGYGLMHYYDLDLSLQYIEAGYRVYVAAVEIEHLADSASEMRSSRDEEEYLAAIGGDDEAYYADVRKKFLDKWQQVLPISRGYRDEAFYYYRLGELERQMEGLEESNCARGAEFERLSDYIQKLEGDIKDRNAELEKAADYARRLEELIASAEKGKEHGIVGRFRRKAPGG